MTTVENAAAREAAAIQEQRKPAERRREGAELLRFERKEEPIDKEKFQRELTKAMIPAIDHVLREKNYEENPFVTDSDVKAGILRYATDYNTVDPAVLEQGRLADKEDMGRAQTNMTRTEKETKNLKQKMTDEIAAGNTNAAQDLEGIIKSKERSVHTLSRSVDSLKQLHEERAKLFDTAEQTMEMRDIIPEIEFKVEVDGRVGRKDELQMTNYAWIEPLLKNPQISDTDKARLEEWKNGNQSDIDKITQWFENQGPEALKYSYELSNYKIDQILASMEGQMPAEGTKPNEIEKIDTISPSRGQREEILTNKSALLKMREENTTKIKEIDEKIEKQRKLKEAEQKAESTSDWMEQYTASHQAEEAKRYQEMKKRERKNEKLEEKQAAWMDDLIQESEAREKRKYKEMKRQERASSGRRQRTRAVAQ